MNISHAIIGLVLVASCGPEASKRDDIGGGADLSSILEDEVLLTDTITAQVDTAVSATASDVEADSASLAFVDDIDIYTRTCKEESDGSAVVKIVLEKSFEKSYTRPLFSGKRTVQVKANRVRTWTQENEIITCARGGKHITFDKEALTGKKLEVTYIRLRDAQISLTRKKTGKTFAWENKLSMSGTRQVDFTALTEDGSDTIISKSVSIQGQTEFSSTRNEVENSVSTETTTISDAPLLIDIRRETSTWEWLSRTIKSGTIEASMPSGARVVTTFSDVVYTEEGRCAATGGQITGSIYEAEATEPMVEFNIDFEAGGNEITFSDNREAVPFDNSDCELNTTETE